MTRRPAPWFLAGVTATVALTPPIAHADPFPSRLGESGIEMVPDAETLPPGSGSFSAAMRFEDAHELVNRFGQSYLSIVTGLGRRVEAGLAARESGLPGDPTPARLLMRGGLKVRVIDSHGPLAGIALAAAMDRINVKPRGSARLIASTGRLWRVRAAAFGGAEADISDVRASLMAGASASALITRSSDVVVQGINGQEGSLVGGAARWAPNRQVGLSLTYDRLLDGNTYRIGLALAVATELLEPRRAKPPAPPPKKEEPEEIPGEEPGPVVYTDERPHFRLKLRPGRVATDSAGRHVPWPGGATDEGAAGAAGEAPVAEGPEAPSAPTAPPPAIEPAPAPAAKPAEPPAKSEAPAPTEPPAIGKDESKAPEAEPSPKAADAPTAQAADEATGKAAPPAKSEKAKPAARAKREVARAQAPLWNRQPPQVTPGDELRRALAAHQAQIRTCVEGHLKRDVSSPRRATVKVSIETDGRVAKLEMVEPRLRATFIETCLRASSASWRLRPQPEPLELEFPLILVTGGGR